MTNEIIESGTAKIVNPLCVDADQEFTVDQVNIIRSTIAPNLTDAELSIFLYQCVRSKLDCFAKQIYAIKRGGKMCIQTGIDGFRLIAERTGKYSPGKDTEFLYCTKGSLLGAKVYVKKMTPDGTWHDISATALLREYNAGQGLWGKMPHVMIEKCAEARALRRAFPADLSGLYSEDEMEQADKKSTAPKVKAAAPKVETVEPKVIDVSESAISEEEWNKLDAYINGHTDLRDKLTKMCRVDSLRDITKTQLGACRGYAQACIDKASDAKSDDK
jgi:phage recombination protein Bet